MKAKRGDRCMTVTGKVSRKQYSKLLTMSKLGNVSVYALINRAIDKWIAEQDVPGCPMIDIPDALMEPVDRCDLYCHGWDDEVREADAMEE